MNPFQAAYARTNTAAKQMHMNPAVAHAAMGVATGAQLAPLIGGLLISIGLSLSANFLIFSIPALFASVLTYYMSSKEIT